MTHGNALRVPKDCCHQDLEPEKNSIRGYEIKLAQRTRNAAALLGSVPNKPFL